MTNTQLKPCPFCGSAHGPEVHRGQIVGTRDNGHRFVRCTNCGATGTYKSEADAIEAWNTRHDPMRTKLRALVKEWREKDQELHVLVLNGLGRKYCAAPTTWKR